jgi:SSS family solute:Na+ symporter
MTNYDYAVIAFYFVFMLGMGWFVTRFVRNTSDYFRGGGQMLWWLVGSSAFMTQFSAWTFTGAASVAYAEGWPILLLYFANAVGFVFNWLYFGARSRQMRVMTAIEAVRIRFGPANEQIFTWLQIPLGTLYAGIWLNGLCVFLSAAFGFDLELTIIVTGVVVVAMTIFAGSWAAVAGDFIQVLILMPVSIVAAILALHAVGGAGAFMDRLPAGHTDLGRLFDSKLLLLWGVAILIKQYISANNLLDSSRYLCVKDGGQARKAAILGAVLFIVGPVIWFIPPMAARILYPDLAAIFPGLKNPAEGAFLAICLATMPAGMLGLLLSGIFAATMSSMDSGLNRNVGIFVKSFYQPVLRPRATDRELIVSGQLTTLVMGILVILAALNFSRMKGIGLFDLMQQFGTLVAVPYTIPLVLCIIVKRTPPWSGWTTMAASFAGSLIAMFVFDVAWLESTFGLGTLSPADRNYWAVASGLLLNVTTGCLWFFGSRVFWNSSPPEYRERVEKFFATMRTPIDFEKEIGEASDRQQGSALGRLCLGYGGFITLLALIPNPLSGRLGFVFCGVVVILVGVLLVRSGRPGRPAA